ncbi:periplasmic protein [Legionella quinlivanii]|uniref:Periplasmic protein n=1 Tax=Legionella quinlivanii TaxID=45073 RepID=A0A0W0Y7W8_9GAMM|nr:translocation/assembly module TamB domain-containing protein [Legionella quinlivanii]KTD53095.1 periplasmic protein [Legionella quinlivanii]SEG17382.1 translocation and assembly module TamB [Legionella quinlivanii DSM 21216]STY10476.1 periplasmic protein [Legionella quinlivanii]
MIFRLVFRKLFYSTLWLLVILSSLLLFLLTTTPGLYLLVKTTSHFVPGTLQFEGLKGEAAGRIHIDKLHYTDKSQEINLTEFQLHWRLKDLLHRRINVRSLQIERLDYKQVPSTQPVNCQTPPSEHADYALPSLPVELLINKLTVQNLRVTLNNEIQQVDGLKLRVQLKKDLWLLDELQLGYQQQQLGLQAWMQTKPPYQAAANLSLNSISPEGAKGELLFAGDQALYSWRGKLNQPGVLSGHGSIEHFSEVNAQFQWADLKWPLEKPELEIAKGQLQITGKLSNLLLQMQAQFTQPLKGQLTLNAIANQDKISSTTDFNSREGKLHLQTLYSLNGKPGLQGSLNASFSEYFLPDSPLKELQTHLKFAGENLENLLLNGQINALYYQQALKAVIKSQGQTQSAQINLGNNQILIKHLPNKPWQLNAALSEPALLHPSLAGLKTRITAMGNFETEYKGKLLIEIAQGSYQIPDKELLAFKGGKFEANLVKSGLKTSGNFNIDSDKSIRLAIDLPKFSFLQADLNQQAIKGSVRLVINSLDFLANMSPEISKTSGQLLANLDIKGSIGKPDLSGLMDLKNGSLVAKRNGLTLSPVDIKLKSQDNHWLVTGNLYAGEKPLKIAGNGDFFPEVKGQLSVDGENLLVMNTAEYVIYLSPHLKFIFTPSSLALNGRLVIPKASLKPQSFNNTVTLSSDVVFKDKKPADNPLHIDANVNVEMGDEVELAVKGLNGFLRGSINLRQLPDGPLNAGGELTITNGKYQAYGQDLTIEQGELLFTGGLIDNPGLNIRAVRKFSNTTATFAGSDQLFDFNPSNIQTLDFGNKLTVGIEVSGRLLSPQVKLFSNPATLSQADILSMLLLGRPANQANKSGGQLLLTAISSMNLDSGSNGLQLVNQLKQKLGVDFNLANNSTYNKQTNQVNDTTSLVVGKAISKRLYLSYNVGLSQADSNVLTLKYLLNKFFSIQVDASTTGSGIDLLYTHQKE